MKQSIAQVNLLGIELGMSEFHSRYQLQPLTYLTLIQLPCLQIKDGQSYLLRLGLHPVLMSQEPIPALFTPRN